MLAEHEYNRIIPGKMKIQQMRVCVCVCIYIYIVRFKMCFKMFMKIKDNRRKHSDFPWVVVLKTNFIFNNYYDGKLKVYSKNELKKNSGLNSIISIYYH